MPPRAPWHLTDREAEEDFTDFDPESDDERSIAEDEDLDTDEPDEDDEVNDD